MTSSMLGMAVIQPLIKAVGEVGFVTLSHLSSFSGFLVWALVPANSAKMLNIALPFQVLGMASQMIPSAKLLQRAGELGVGKGQALSVPATLASIYKMFIPRLFL